MNKLLKRTFLSFIYFLLYLPLIILIIYSFNESRYSMKIGTLTLKWYYELMNNELLLKSAKNSFVLAFFSSIISTALASIAASIFNFYRFKLKNSLQQFLLLMIIIPDIIFAIALLIFFNLFSFKLGFTTLLIAHISASFPFATLLIQNRVNTLNKNLLLVSQDLGAYDFYAFRKIIFPLLKSAMLSAFFLSFLFSFDDVLISYFTSGPSYQLLPLYIYSMIRSGIQPEINALCSFLFLSSLIIVSVSYPFMSSSKK